VCVAWSVSIQSCQLGCLVSMHTCCCILIYGARMCYDIDAPNAGQTPNDRINRCLDVTWQSDVL
jgi:hypothetical protein